MRSVYGVDLDVAKAGRPFALADLVVWLPAGCAFWKSWGGPAALSDEVSALQMVDFSIRVSDYHSRGGKGKKPKPPQDPPYAYEKRAEEARNERKAAAFMRRARARG